MSRPASDAFTGMARAACPVCERAGCEPEIRWRSGYHICRCPACGSLFTTPMPTAAELDAYYQGFLYGKPNPAEIAGAVRRRRREIQTLFGLRDGKPGARFLDHGGGTGAVFGAARELGLDGYFSDLDQHAVEFVRATFGLDDAHFVPDLHAARGTFDYILSDNVIEHVVEPAGLLSSLVAALAPGGTLVVKTPSAGASEHYFYPLTLREYVRTAWRHNPARTVVRMVTSKPVWYCDPPRHLFSFSRVGLERLADRVVPHGVRYAVEHYGTPVFGNTITSTVLRRPKGVRSAVARSLAAPLIPLEVATKAVQILSLRAGMISAGGLVLRVERGLA